jgi:hypothetical protein
LSKYETKEVSEAAYLLTLPGVKLCLTPRIADKKQVYVTLEHAFSDEELLKHRELLVNEEASVEPNAFMRARENVLNLVHGTLRGVTK